MRITEVGSNAGEGTAFGFQLNLDFTSDLSGILWKDFVGLPDYPEVGAYKGGSQYQYGVWRSEENSCMNNNIPIVVFNMDVPGNIEKACLGEKLGTLIERK